MTAAKPISIDAYIATRPEAVRARLEQMRTTIRKAAPNAVEQISYSIPAFKIGGKVLVYFAAWKEHVALYPASATLLAGLADKLSDYEVTKGTIRFPHSQPVPYPLIARITRLRVAEIAAAAVEQTERSGRRRVPRERTPQ